MSTKPLLIVDDEKAILGLMEIWLQGEGYSVVAVSTGKEAIHKIENGNFLAVLLDLGLADMKGMDVLKTVKNLKPSLPVIVVTGLHDETEARNALSHGALEYITKPVNFSYLLRLLQTQAAS